MTSRSLLRALAALMFCALTACGDGEADRWRDQLVEVPQVRLDLREIADAEKLDQLRRRTEQSLAHPEITPLEAARLYFDLGRHYMAHELYPAAEACFRNVITLNPAQRTSHYLLGALHQLDGRPEAAESHLERSLALAPNDGHTRLRLGDIALARGHIEDARTHFNAALAQPATALAARAGLGRSAVLAGDNDTAIRELRAVLSEQPGADALRHPLAQALRDQGDTAAARAELARAGTTSLQYDDPILDALSTLITGARSLHMRARRARESGDLDTALHHYRLALEVDPDFALAHYGMGQVHAARGVFGQAAEAFAKAVAADPDFVEGWFDLAAAEQRLERPEAAQAALESLLSMAPDHVDARLRLAALLHRSGRHDQAMAELQHVLERDPLHADALQSLVMLLTDADRHEAAVTRLAAALDAASSSQDRGRVLALSAHVALRRGDVDAAERGYREAVAADADLADAWFNLGQLLSRRDQNAAALDALRRAAQLDPTRGNAALALARLEMALGLWQDARRTLDAAADAENAAHDLVEARLELLVAAPDPAVRDAPLALSLIETLRQQQPHLRWIELRAYALAELGEFEAAAMLLQRLLEASESSAAPEAVQARLRAALAEVLAGRPIRLAEPAPVRSG